MPRKPLWRGAFNFGQYVLSLAAAGGVLAVLHVHASEGALAMRTLVEIGGTLVAGIGFFCVRFLIAGIVVFRRTAPCGATSAATSAPRC